MDNYQIADMFSLLSKLMDIHGENSFKAKSYSNAAFQIEKLDAALANMHAAHIASVRGIGDAIAQKIQEILSTGKMRVLDELIVRTPEGVIQMLNIKGIGPKKIHTIWKEMGIESVGELLYACNENRLTLYKGFGEKTQQQVKAAIEFLMAQQGWFLFQQGEVYHEVFKATLESAGLIYSVVGEFAMQSDIVDSLTYLIVASSEHLAQFATNLPGLAIEHTEPGNIVLRAEQGPRIILQAITEQLLSNHFFETCCSAEFAQYFKKQFYNLDPGQYSATNYNQALFEAAGITFLPPFLRWYTTALELAISQKLPTIITTNDIKGIIHTHSKWSDGSNTIAEMASEAKEKGFEYLVISDHSKTASYASGLSIERVMQQHAEIDALNKQMAPFRIFKSIESDILTDGSLDYEDGILQHFDLVIASVHAVLNMTEEKAMARLLKAIENPYTTILGHMTGRLLLSRNGYPVNHKKIIDACAANFVAIELNAHPRRLDMDWKWIPYALERGVCISINPDAHSTEGYNDIRYGVLAAQKGLLTAAQNLSSFSLSQFESYLATVRQQKGLSFI
jgi:DNA polymerase (family 10)